MMKRHLEIVDELIVLQRPTRPVRMGWAQASKEIADLNDDALLMGDFPNDDDEEPDCSLPPYW